MGLFKPNVEKLKRERNVPKLIKALNNNKVRESASEALYEIGEPAVVQLIHALKFSLGYECLYAAKVLGKINDTRAVEPLIDMLNSGLLYKVHAAEALGVIGDNRAVEPLISALKDIDELMRRFTAIALGRIGDKKAVQPLIAILKDSDDFVRGNAAWALGEIKDSSAVEPLKALLKDINPEVCKYAREALSKINK